MRLGRSLGLILAGLLAMAGCSEQPPPEPDNNVSETISVRIPAAMEQAPAIDLPQALDLPLTTSGLNTDFSMLSPNAGPTTIAIAPDGDIWYTLSSANAIGRMHPDGSGMVEYSIPTPDSSPRIISLGSDGNMWFSEHNSGKMGRITPDGEITEFPLSSQDSQPRAIALNSDGNIWVGMFASSRIGRITPEGVVTEWDIPTPDSGPRALAAGPDGNIWFSEFKAGKIGRITPDGDITEYTLPRPQTGPGDITAGADGNMWFLELNGLMDNTPVNGNRVGRITLDGTITEFDIPSEGSTPINIAVGPDRNVWYTKNNTLGRVTPAGIITEFPVAIGPARTVGLSAGSDRQTPDRLIDRLWFTDPLNNRIGYLQFK
jgi:virginiamycin B lyase